MGIDRCGRFIETSLRHLRIFLTHLNLAYTQHLLRKIRIDTNQYIYIYIYIT